MTIESRQDSFTEAQAMRALQYARYGEPHVLHINRVDVPTPRRNQTILRVKSTSVNRMDVDSRAGRNRLMDGFGFPKGVGVDVVGTVVGGAIDQETEIVSGALVWGYLGMKPVGSAGAAADYVAVDSMSLGLAPQHVSPDEASAIPLCGLAALQALRAGKVDSRPGQRVLIVGATGGVGSLAVQIARHWKADVTALVSATHMEDALRFGAHQALSYAQTEKIPRGFDAVVDCSGKLGTSHVGLARMGGRVVVASPTGFPALLSAAFTLRRPAMLSTVSRRADLDYLRDLIDQGHIHPVLRGIFDLDEAVSAHTAAEAGGVGKVIIHVS